ncbi:MAG: alpha/beta fold hydrolase [Actinobacteria bacterium]|nr:alpha/beta fold hydrolase [Actinomycetota bacterium]
MTRRGMKRFVALTLGVALLSTGALATAAVAKNAKQESEAVEAPPGLPDFYSVPAELPGKPGKIIKSEKVKAPEIDGTVYRVMYTTLDLNDNVIPVTGVIVVPEAKAPSGGFPVLSWAHGTNGMADECAASLEPAEAAPQANALLAQGWLVVATDYQGEGTPGLHPYIAGENAARDTIDIVRAAGSFKPAKAGPDYVAWGHSQGGHTAMHVLRISEDYAPDLTLHGVVAGAPPSQFNLLYDFLITSDFKHYLLMAAGGLHAAYGDEAAPLEKTLTPEGIELLDALEETCDLGERFADVTVEDVTLGNPFEIPEWQELLSAMDPQNFTSASDAPLLIIHGGDDEQIPTASSQLLIGQICPEIPAIERWVYPGQSHARVIGPSFDDMVAWINLRFNDSADAYTPTGQGDIEITGCAALP